MKKVLKTIYEMIMILLVMVTIITLWTEDTYNSTINWIVWGVFFTDFVVRFITAKEKWAFIKENPFLLIAVIPFDQFFQVARIVRLIYLFRIKTITKYYITPYVEKLTFQSKTLIATVSLSFLFVASIIVWNLENTVSTYFDALFVIFGYLLFFGHRVFEIEDQISIWILTGVSILGIGVQGMALHWVFNRVERFYKQFKNRHKSDSDEQPELRSEEQ